MLLSRIPRSGQVQGCLEWHQSVSAFFEEFRVCWEDDDGGAENVRSEM